MTVFWPHRHNPVFDREIQTSCCIIDIAGPKIDEMKGLTRELVLLTGRTLPMLHLLSDLAVARRVNGATRSLNGSQSVISPETFRRVSLR